MLQQADLLRKCLAAFAFLGEDRGVMKYNEQKEDEGHKKEERGRIVHAEKLRRPVEKLYR